MLDQFKRAVAGSPLRLSASDWNDMREAAGLLERDQPDLSAGVPTMAVNPCLKVIVYNASASQRTAGDILSVTTALAEFPTKMREAARRPVLSGTTPTAITNTVVVLLDPIASGAYGQAAVEGVATCTVSILNTSHLYATPTVGDATKLTSAATGPIRILTPQTSTGDKSCMVLLQCWGQSFTQTYVRIVSVDNGGSVPIYTVREVTGHDGTDVDGSGLSDFAVYEENNRQLLVGDDIEDDNPSGWKQHVYELQTTSTGDKFICLCQYAGEGSDVDYVPGFVSINDEQWLGRGRKRLGKVLDDGMGGNTFPAAGDSDHGEYASPNFFVNSGPDSAGMVGWRITADSLTSTMTFTGPDYALDFYTDSGPNLVGINLGGSFIQGTSFGDMAIVGGNTLGILGNSTVSIGSNTANIELTTTKAAIALYSLTLTVNDGSSSGTGHTGSFDPTTKSKLTYVNGILTGVV